MTQGVAAAPANVSTIHHTFLEDDAPEAWDRIEYAPGTYSSFVWGLELDAILPSVRELAARRGGLKHLDFACGTGRVLAALGPFARTAHGLDLSPVMVASAQRKVPAADVRLGDLLLDPTVVDRDYDLITAFRFFLNADAAVRLPYLRELAARLRAPDSLLIFNVHANAWSMAGLAAGLDATRTMTVPETLQLIGAAGLAVAEWHGIGVMPAGRRNLRALVRPMRAIDGALARREWLRGVSRDLLFVCRRR